MRKRGLASSNGGFKVNAVSLMAMAEAQRLTA